MVSGGQQEIFGEHLALQAGVFDSGGSFGGQAMFVEGDVCE